MSQVKSLRTGDSGKEVSELQQKLVEAGESVDAFELNNGIFNFSTKEAVISFQSRHVDALGKPLTHDGIVGPATDWALDHPGRGAPAYTSTGWVYDASKVEPTVVSVVSAAVSDLGLAEDPDGSNDGAGLKKFKTYGRPWCALAVSHWYENFKGGIPFGTQAAVISIYAWGKKNNKVLVAGQPALPGDVIIILRQGGHGHTGIVVNNLDNGLLCTVEGNASNAVRGCVRKQSDLAGVVRPW